MKDKNTRYKLMTGRIALIGLGLAVVFWILHAVMDVFIFHEAALIPELFPTDPHKLFELLAVLCIIIGIGVYGQAVVNKRKRAEEETTKAKQMLEDITHGITDGVFLVSKDFKIMWANRAILEQYNCKLEEIVGEYCHKLTHHQENPCEPPHDVCPIQEIIETGKPVTVTHTHFDSSGNEFYAEVTAYPIRNEKGEIIQFVHLSRDVTERKRAEEERLRMEQQVQLTGRLAAVGELAAGVAHELNNPLTAVQGYAQLLASREDLDESIRSDVEAIFSQAKRAAKTTSNLLSFARRHEPEKRLISINELIEKSHELHAYRLRVNNIEVSMELEPDLPFTMADFHQMQQVLVNLFTNAEQAMTEAHGKGKLLIKTERDGETIRITFTDDGPGIAEENLSRIFESFFTTKEAGKGTGLGLNICRGIVQNHGGNIYATSEPGEGATFVVEIPILSEDQATAEQTGSVEAQSAQS